MSDGFLCEHTILISPEWLHEITSVNDTKARWKSVQEITEDTDYLYFILRPRVAHIIPKRAFSQPEAAQQFQDTAKRFWREARGEAVPAPAHEEATWPPPPRTIQPS